MSHTHTTSSTRYRHLWSCVWLAVILLPSTGSAQCPPKVYHDGEVLTYAVRWGFFRLGTVEIHQRVMDAVERRYELLLRVRSAPHLPFIDVTFDNRSEQLAGEHGLRHEVITSAGDTTIYRVSPSGTAYYTEDRSDGVTVRMDTVEHPFPMFDALGLFMIARCLSNRTVDTSFATLLEHEGYATDLRTGLDRETITVDAYPDPQQAVVIGGFAHWVGNGYAGMTGDFTGWISDDDRAVPLRAELKIFLGSISLELESIERSPERVVAARQMTSETNKTGRPE